MNKAEQLARDWNSKAKGLFGYLSVGKKALESLGYTEDNAFDDHGGNTVVEKAQKKFNTTAAFFVGVFMMSYNLTDINEFDLNQILTIFDIFFWAGEDTADIEESIREGNFFSAEGFEDD